MNRKTRKLISNRLPKLLLIAVIAAWSSMLLLSDNGLFMIGAMMLGVGLVGSFSKSFSLGGFSFSNGQTAASTYDSVVMNEIPLPVGNVVTDWVKTDADTAACNLAGGHGKTSGTYDVYWTIAGVNYARYGVTNTITTNACALDGGAGDDFPASATSGVVITKQVVTTCPIDGDAVVLFGVFLRSTDTAAVASADFQDASSNSIEQFDLTEVDTTATGMNHAYQQTAARALLTGALITKVAASNGSATAAATLFVLAGIDSTP